MRRGWVVALVAALVAGAALAVGPASTAGASVTVSGTVHWTGGTLPDGAVAVRACPGFFLCSSGSVAPDAPVVGGSYSLAGLPDAGPVLLWPLSSGKTVSGGNFQVGLPASIPDLATVAVPVDLTVSAAIVRAHVDHPGPTPYAAGTAGVFACPAGGDVAICGSGRYGLTDAAGDVVFAVAPGSTYQIAPFAGSNPMTALFGPAGAPVPLGDGATAGPTSYTLASATITASVGVPAGVVADTLVFACPSPELPTRNVNGAPACSSGSTPRSSGFGASPRTLTVPTTTAFNVAATGSPQGLPSFGSLPPLTAHTAVGALADGGAASPSFGLGAVSGTVSLPGGPPPSGATTVDFCGMSMVVGDSCASPLWRTVPDAGGHYLALLPEGSYAVAPMMGTAVSPSVTVAVVASPPTLASGTDFAVASNAFGVVTVTSTATGGGFVAQVRACRSPETPAAPGTCPTLRTGVATISSPRTDVLYLGRATWNVATLASFSGGLFNVAPNPADSITITGNENLTRSYSVDPPTVGVTTGGYSVANAISGSVVVQLCPVGNTPGPSCPGAQNVFMTGVNGNWSQAVPEGNYQVLAGYYAGAVGSVPTQTSPTAIVNLVGNTSITCNFTFDASLVAPATNSCVGGVTNPDGVSDAVEQGVPGGDGNLDGTPDWRQANVTSLPSDGGTGSYVTIATTTPGTTLEAVATTDGSGSPEPLPYGVVGFSVKGVAPGATVHVDVYVPGTSVPTGYWKHSDTNGDLVADTWVDFSSYAVITGPLVNGGYKISLELIDRTSSQPGQGDDDATPGVIRDPGGPTDATTPSSVFSGFFAPIDNLPKVNAAKAGQAIPVKWRLTDGNGVGISDPATFVSLTSSGGASCSTGSPDAIEQYTGNSGLQYLGNGNWQFNWKTPKSYAGQCRRMKLTLADGEHVADFQFK